MKATISVFSKGSLGSIMGNFLQVGLILLMVGSASCELLSISDDSYPYIQFSDAPGMRIDWNRGYAAQRLASSSVVRVNGRGVKFMSGRHSLLRLTEEHWTKVNCTYNPHALCGISSQGMVVSRVFPVWPNTAYSLMDTGEASEYVRNILPMHCPESESGRTMSDDLRDISLCDVVGGNGDFVYDIGNHVLYISPPGGQLWLMIVTSVAAVYTAIVLSKDLDIILRQQDKENISKTTTWKHVATPLLLSAIILVTIVLPDTFSGTSPLSSLVTVEDSIMFMVLVTFVSMRVLWMLALRSYEFFQSQIATTDLNVVNPLICILILISIRFYSTGDNPYAVALTVVFTVRWVMKLHLDQCSEPRDCLHLLVDGTILACLIYYAVSPFYDHVLVHVALFAIQTWGVGMAVVTLAPKTLS